MSKVTLHPPLRSLTTTDNLEDTFFYEVVENNKSIFRIKSISLKALVVKLSKIQIERAFPR